MTELEWLDMFSENLNGYLDEYGMSQADLAKETGLSKSAISRYCAGKRIPSTTTLIKFAYAFDCDAEDLIMFGENVD